MSLKPEPVQQNSDNDKVELKPIMGIEPGFYLAVLYSIVLVAILFGLLILPGILNKGSVVHFDSEPRGVAIKIDGAFVGATPFKLPVPAGKHEIEYKLPGFQVEKRTLDFGGRVFASLFFPKIATDHIELICMEPVGTLAEGASEFAAWTFAGEPTLAYQVPLALSEAAYRMAPSIRDDIRVQRESMMVLQEAARYASTEASVRDLSRAVFMLRGTGLSSSPSVVLGGISDILHYVSASPDAARWLAATLPQSMSKNILASTWYATGEPSMGNTSQDERTLGTGKMPPKPVIIGSLTFHPVPGGQLGTVDGIKRDIPVNTFLIAEKEISLTAWNEFLKANPEWEPANATDLLEKGLISENYLQEYSAPAYPKDAVSGISWFAAKAFCAWLQGQMPVQMQELTVDLPTEIQWQYAAELDSIGATGFEGGLWEWCSDYYVPHSFLPAASNSRVIGPERSIRGGSWINSPDSIRTSTRASLPPRICSPFVGFRPIIELVSGTIE